MGPLTWLVTRVTLFPNSGMCIGIQFMHVAADGMAINRFTKTWASICRSELEGDTTSTCIKNALPFLDRSVIKDPNVLSRASCLRNGGTSSRHGKRRATFTLTRVHIDRLKSWILSKTEDPLLRISTFVATCANILVCLIKSKEIGKTKVLNPDFHHFVFLADCRECLGYPIPNIFFGNCLESCFVSVKREELVGQHGIVSATRALGAKVKELEEEGGLLREPE
ncbi:hypothetical protein CDL15_Pgr002777 [Punica granatum]|uniref:Uncharacterized protein n=1 Tax=Punica granatum TaxID=22663 RepID=A0A218X1J0_PUNGR|nr:hypothetical protein CDL15_Pgr002777 [Punica granatum]